MKIKRNGWIEFCRLVFCFCIVSHHSLLLNDPGYVPLISGFLSVEFFYILTGYFLFSSAYKTTDNKGDSGFSEVYKRLKKVFPYYFNVWIASFIICHVVHGHNDTGNVFKDLIYGIPQLLFLSMTGLSGGRLGVWDYVGTAWYLSALSFAILILYPIMRKWKLLFSSSIGPAVALTIYGFLFFKYGSFGEVNERSSFIYDGCLRAIAGLCLGSFCYYLANIMRRHELSAVGKLIFTGIQLLSFITILILMNDNYGMSQVIILILFFILIVSSFSGSTYVNESFSGAFFEKCGHFSMIVFITQSLVYIEKWLPFPSAWKGRYLVFWIYVLLLSLANMVIVLFFQTKTKPLFQKIVLWNMETE